MRLLSVGLVGLLLSHSPTFATGDDQCSALQYAFAFGDFEAFLVCSDFSIDDVFGIINSDLVQDMLACLPIGGASLDTDCLVEAVQGAIGSFNSTYPSFDTDDIFSAFSEWKDTVDDVCGCMDYLEDISDACLEELSSNLGIPLDDTIGYLITGCGYYDDFQSCTILETFESECLAPYSQANITEFCEDNVVPIGDPTELIPMIDFDLGDLGCAFGANVIIRMSEDWVEECEAAEPSLDISLFESQCQNWTESSRVATDDEDDESERKDDGEEEGGHDSGGKTGFLAALVAIPALIAVVCIGGLCLRRKSLASLARQRGEFIGQVDPDNDERMTMELGSLANSRAASARGMHVRAAAEEDENEEIEVVSAITLPVSKVVTNPLAVNAEHPDSRDIPVAFVMSAVPDKERGF